MVFAKFYLLGFHLLVSPAQANKSSSLSELLVRLSTAGRWASQARCCTVSSQACLLQGLAEGLLFLTCESYLCSLTSGDVSPLCVLPLLSLQITYETHKQW